MEESSVRTPPPFGAPVLGPSYAPSATLRGLQPSPIREILTHETATDNQNTQSPGLALS